MAQRESAKPSAKATDSPEVAKAKRGALAAYRGYWSARNKAMGTADAEDRSVDKYSVGDAWAQLFHELKQLQRNGRIVTGEAKNSPEITRVELKDPPKEPHDVAIRDCLDMSDVEVVDGSNREPVKGAETPPKYEATALVQEVGNGWLVAKLTFHMDRPC